jgi:hypothetical protein
MSKSKQITITVQGTTIGIMPRPEGDYISLTDMVRNFDGAAIARELTGQRRNRVFVYDSYLGILNEGGEPL